MRFVEHVERMTFLHLFSINSLGDLDTKRSCTKSSHQKMKQWRLVAIVISLIIVLLIANFRCVYLVFLLKLYCSLNHFLLFLFHYSIQIKKRSRRNENITEPSAVSVADLNGTAGQKSSKNSNKSSVGEYI